MIFCNMLRSKPLTTLFSTHFRRMVTSSRMTLPKLRNLYESGTPITMLTAYDYPTALHADQAGVDIVLVGDSLGMVVLGERTTQAVTMEQMLHHSRAARRGVKEALLIADLPFGSYETSVEKGVENAIRLVKEAGVDAVKLEGGTTRYDLIREIVSAGVAVMGHVGLLPQAVSRAGGFRAVGKSAAEAKTILEDAKAIEKAGVFSMVIECVPERVGGVITRAVNVPTMGIGSGALCDGQVLVYHDMLGIISHPHHGKVAPRFSKCFAEAGYLIDRGIREYCEEVRERKFPSSQYTPYRIPDEEFEEFAGYAHDREDSHLSALKKDGAILPADSEPITLY